MSELYPSDSLINALSGTKDAEQEVQYPAIYESPYYTTFYKMLYRTLNVARRAGDFRVYKDGDLAFGVRAGKFNNGTTIVNYNGASGVSLTDNATNSIYITADGTLHVATDGFPALTATPHIPLAEISTSGGTYDFEDMIDLRSRSIYRVLGNMTAANSNTLSGGGNADSLHIHSGNSIVAMSILSQHLAETLRDLIPTFTMTPTDNQNGTAGITIQITDCHESNLLTYNLVRIWTTSSSSLEPSTESEINVSSGEILNTIQSNTDIEIISCSNGLIHIEVSSETTTSFTMACALGGQIKTCNVAITVP